MPITSIIEAKKWANDDPFFQCGVYENIEVKPLNNLAVTFAQQEKAQVFIRGLRTEQDFNYEMQMATMNKTLDPMLESVFIPASQSLSHISSSLIKEVHSLGGDISTLVPKEVANFFKKLRS